MGDGGAHLPRGVRHPVRARRSDAQRPIRLYRAQMKRSASLDLLRGGAAFAVANSSLSDLERAVSAVRGSLRDRRRRGLFCPQRLRARAADRRLGDRAAVAQSRRVSRPAVDAHHSALCRRARRHRANDRQPDHCRLCPLPLLRREFLRLRQSHRFLPGSLESGGRRMVLCVVRPGAFRDRHAPGQTRQAARGGVRDFGHCRRSGA